jgi:hypothetical protein
MPSFYHISSILAMLLTCCELLDNIAFEGKSPTMLGVDGAPELMTASPSSLHAISIISTQVACTLGIEIAVGHAQVSRLWRLYRYSGAIVPNVV